MEATIILKVLTGSQAHGLANEDSDYDYRSVYVEPTDKILSLRHIYEGTHSINTGVDNTSYEIGHFLRLATKCNPSILEMFMAPVAEATKDGHEMRKLFPYVWNPNDAYNAFVGYSREQCKKLLDKKLPRSRLNKYAVAYVRVLWQLVELLSTGSFNVKVDGDLKQRLLKFKEGNFSYGEVIDYADHYKHLANNLMKTVIHEPDIKKVNDFLISIRKTYWRR